MRLLYQQLTHYHDIMYSSGRELAETGEHNTHLIRMLCIHMLNHVLKVPFLLSLHAVQRH